MKPLFSDILRVLLGLLLLLLHCRYRPSSFSSLYSLADFTPLAPSAGKRAASTERGYHQHAKLKHELSD